MSKKQRFWGIVGLALTLVLPLLVEAAGIVQTLAITLIDTTGFPVSQIYFSVNDVDGSAITDLQTAEFELYENDVPIPSFDVITVEHPLLIGVVIDSAASFKSWEGNAPRVDHAKEVTRWLVAPQYERLLPDDEVAIFAFQAGEPVRLVDFTYDHQLVLDQGITTVSTNGNNYTALFDILRQAIGETATRAGARRRVLIVFSDGIDSTSAVDVDRVIQQAQEAHLLIYTVGMGPNLAPDIQGSAFLRRLADETGGKYLWYRPGRAEAEVGVLTLLDDLVMQRGGYKLTYTSNQYEGNPNIKLVVERSAATAEDTATFEVPPLPPVVTIDAIQQGEILTGIVDVQPSVARAQRELDRVEYRIDDELVFTSRSAPWIFEWDTRDYANSSIDYEEHTLSVVVCDLAQQCSEPYQLLVGTRLPQPTPTPMPLPTSTVVTTESQTISMVSIASLIVSLAALVLIIIYMRRGGGKAVGRVVQEVRRKTRVWMSQTKIFGAAGGETNHVPTLTVVSEVENGKRFPLEGRVLFLGRDTERADVVFEWDDYISRRHAKLAQEGEQWYLWDMGSANRTWLNQSIVRASLSEGVELEEAFPLYDGDVVKLGPELTLRFDLPNRVQHQPATENATGDDVESGTPARVDVNTPTRVFPPHHISQPPKGPDQTSSETAETLYVKK